MLRRFRIPKLRVPWWLPAAPLAVSLVLLAAGNQFIKDWRIAISATGLACLPVLRRLASDARHHRRHHWRMDPQHDEVVDTCRFVYEYDERPYPARLDDQREVRPGADVVRIRPRGAPRHSRPRRARRPSA
jgi:hypothetical protein